VSLSEQRDELLDGEPGRLDDHPQGAAIELVVHGDRQRRTARALQPDVTPTLAHLDVTELRECSDARAG